MVYRTSYVSDTFTEGFPENERLTIYFDMTASSDYANNIVLYDTRAKEVKKLKMNLRINALAWNPMEAFILTAASEDYK